MACRHPATLRVLGTRYDLNGYHHVRGDEFRWLLRIIDAELTNCELTFTAKSDLKDPDSMAEIQVSSVSNGITVNSNTGNELDATIVIPSQMTESIDFCEEFVTMVNQRRVYPLHYDVQLVRNGTPVNSPKVQTFFRQQNHRFYLIEDATRKNS